MRVDLRGLWADVAELLLHMAEVGSTPITGLETRATVAEQFLRVAPRSSMSVAQVWRDR